MKKTLMVERSQLHPLFQVEYLREREKERERERERKRKKRERERERETAKFITESVVLVFEILPPRNVLL